MRPSPLSADLAVSLVGAFLWTTVDAVRIGPVGSLSTEFPALLGSTSLVLGVGVVSLGRARPFGDGLRAVAAGAAIASFPLAMVATVLERATHHRALGGVTFAFVAAVVVAFAVAAAWRVLVVARRGTRPARSARGLLVVASVASAGAAATILLLGSRAPGATPVMSGLVDGLLGAALLGLSARAARWLTTMPSRSGTVTVAWLCVVLAGVVLALREPSLCSALARRAPVAFAIGAGCGG